MIFPWLRGFLNHRMAPLTWTLILLNVYIFMATADGNSKKKPEVFQKEAQYQLTGILYHQYLGRTGVPGKNEVSILGIQGLRDSVFVANADKYNFRGDQIAISEWKNQMTQFRETFEKKQSRIFGVSTSQVSPIKWITYQFMHAGVGHLLSNMLLLFIFAGALETLVGGLGIISIYLLSGIAGALAFVLISDSSLVPMIGASGSLSGIMAFYAAYEKRKLIPYFYFLSPLEGFYGKIWLPTWFIFPLFFVTDFASLFGTVEEFGSGVAYTAHIGGMIFGAAAGLYWRQKHPQSRLIPSCEESVESESHGDSAAA